MSARPLEHWGSQCVATNRQMRLIFLVPSFGRVVGSGIRMRSQSNRAATSGRLPTRAAKPNYSPRKTSLGLAMYATKFEFCAIRNPGEAGESLFFEIVRPNDSGFLGW